jgi:hypothetical protein
MFRCARQNAAGLVSVFLRAQHRSLPGTQASYGNALSVVPEPA